MFLMPSTKEGIINEFTNFMNGDFSSWSLGLSNDPDKSLFEENNAKETEWICMQTDDYSVAKEIEKYFIDAGCNNIPVEGNDSFNCIYAFKNK